MFEYEISPTSSLTKKRSLGDQETQSRLSNSSNLSGPRILSGRKRGGEEKHCHPLGIQLAHKLKACAGPKAKYLKRIFVSRLAPHIIMHT